jgi:hypothetical protein
MSTYQRPAFPVQEYRDDLGRPISYGQRWEGSPPEDAYSRISYPERFAPLHAVAGALIDWLQETFDVSVDESPEVASDLLRPPEDAVRAVRIVPSDKRAAVLIFVLTGFPGVYLHAGALHDFHFPVCGCDACDEGVKELADDLEWTVRTVVQGGYTERFLPGRQWIEYRLEEIGAGMHSGRSRRDEYPPERLQAAETVLPPSGQWNPWPELH